MGKRQNNEIQKEDNTENTKKKRLYSEDGKKLKALREKYYTDKELLKKACPYTNNYTGQCRGYNIKEAEMCTDCEVYCDKLTQEILGAAIGYSKKLIERYEQGYNPASRTAREAYKNFFGEERYNEIVTIGSSNTGDIFSKKGTSKLTCFLHRTDKQGAEFESLFEKVKENKVTIVCADGGVGKTTFVEQFLYEYENYVDYYQTIAINTDLQGEDFDLITSFLSADNLLTMSGDKEFSNYCSDEKIENPTEKDRQNWVRKKLNELSGLFVLDNLTCVTGNEISKLETEFPKCKFIITTRRVTDVGLNVNADIVLNLEPFKDGQEQKLFELYYGRTLNAEEKKIFDEQINSWCCGNAEAICYVAKMFSNYSVLKLSDYYQIEKQGLKFATGLKKDTSKSSLADKLSALMLVDETLRSWLKGEDVKNTGVFNVLSILSLTEMQEIPVQSLVDFLCESQKLQAKVDFEEEIKKLELKGLIKFNSSNNYVKMHPLICKALKLNGIEKKHTVSVVIFAILMIEDAGVRNILANKFNIPFLYKIDIPEGIRVVNRLELWDGWCCTEINFSNTVEIIGNSAFVQPMDISFFINNAFYDILDMEYVAFFLNDYNTRKEIKFNFSDSIIEIEKNAFSNNRLANFELPKNLKKIGKYAFSCCCGIEQLIIPNSVTEMDASAFADCFSLKEVFLSNQLEEISFWAFRRCISLEKIIIPDSVKTIGYWAFDGCRSLKKIKFGNGVVEIGEGAFCENASLKSIKLPKSLKLIGTAAFCSCYQLEEIDFCNVEKICVGAFRGCKSLKSIKIPSTVKEIEKDAFYGCPLTEITVEEGCPYKVKNTEEGVELYNVKNEIVFSSSDKPNLKTEDEWFLENGNLIEALLDDKNKELSLINNYDEREFFERDFVYNTEKETYFILTKGKFLDYPDRISRHVYKLCKQKGKLCLREERDFNTCVKIFGLYHENDSYIVE